MHGQLERNLDEKPEDNEVMWIDKISGNQGRNRKYNSGSLRPSD